ncbi:hypothetical protein LWC35_31325 [Pseudonocardia kujensis]|uniref:hypothetical protein n=1 Tax=Pseudonocardia kujensis TaxID=1128675 RepID=UPI001E638503|nr:hypothetical protein [Pseudonocardia kujensis]MCE0767363.1 hypothetical protein [Pseudonocardia kujensis]
MADDASTVSQARSTVVQRPPLLVLRDGVVVARQAGVAPVPVLRLDPALADPSSEESTS